MESLFDFAPLCNISLVSVILTALYVLKQNFTSSSAVADKRAAAWVSYGWVVDDGVGQ